MISALSLHSETAAIIGITAVAVSIITLFTRGREKEEEPARNIKQMEKKRTRSISSAVPSTPPKASKKAIAAAVERDAGRKESGEPMKVVEKVREELLVAATTDSESGDVPITTAILERERQAVPKSRRQAKQVKKKKSKRNLATRVVSQPPPSSTGESEQESEPASSVTEESLDDLLLLGQLQGRAPVPAATSSVPKKRKEGKVAPVVPKSQNDDDVQPREVPSTDRALPTSTPPPCQELTPTTTAPATPATSPPGSEQGSPKSGIPVQASPVNQSTILQRIATLESELARRKTAESKHRKELEERATENARLHALLQKAQAASADQTKLTSEVKILRDTNNVLTKNLSGLQISLRDAQSRAEATAAQHATAARKAEETVRHHVAELSEVRTALEGARSDAEAFKALTAQLQSMIAQRDQEIDGIRASAATELEKAQSERTVETEKWKTAVAREQDLVAKEKAATKRLTDEMANLKCLTAAAVEAAVSASEAKAAARFAELQRVADKSEEHAELFRKSLILKIELVSILECDKKKALDRVAQLEQELLALKQSQPKPGVAKEPVVDASKYEAAAGFASIMRSYGAEIETSRAENAQLRAKLQEAAAKIIKLNEMNANAARQMADERERAKVQQQSIAKAEYDAGLSSVMRSFGAQSEALHAENSQLKSKVHELEGKISNLSCHAAQERVNVQAELAAKAEAAAGVSSIMRSYAAQFEAAQAENAQLRSKIEQISKASADASRHMGEERAKVQAELVAKAEAAAGVSSVIRSYGAHFEAAQAENAQLRSKFEELNKSTAEAARRNTEERAKVQSELAAKAEAVHALSSMTRSLASQIQDSRAEIEQLRKTAAQIADQHAESIKKHTEAAAKSQQEIIAKSEANAGLNSTVHSLGARLEDAHREIEQLHTQLHQTSQALEAADREIKSANTTKSCNDNDNQSALIAAAEAAAGLSKTIAVMGAKLEDSLAAQTHNADEITALRSRVGSLQSNLCAKEKEVVGVKSELAKAKEESDELRARVGRMGWPASAMVTKFQLEQAHEAVAGQAAVIRSLSQGMEEAHAQVAQMEAAAAAAKSSEAAKVEVKDASKEKPKKEAPQIDILPYVEAIAGQAAVIRSMAREIEAAQASNVPSTPAPVAKSADDAKVREVEGELSRVKSLLDSQIAQANQVARIRKALAEYYQEKIALLESRLSDASSAYDAALQKQLREVEEQRQALASLHESRLDNQQRIARLDAQLSEASAKLGAEAERVREIEEQRQALIAQAQKLTADYEAQRQQWADEKRVLDIRLQVAERKMEIYKGRAEKAAAAATAAMEVGTQVGVSGNGEGGSTADVSACGGGDGTAPIAPKEEEVSASEPVTVNGSAPPEATATETHQAQVPLSVQQSVAANGGAKKKKAKKGKKNL
ncbi:hypothetical protein HK104_004517 [Borealophlyctis nickersoniae]|nr:hypothetical protein HK104_004517 [Borealophlyctis nickersoniae]